MSGVEALFRSFHDDEHERPLLSSLDHGFTNFEANIWPVDGNLLIAHDEEELEPDYTLR